MNVAQAPGRNHLDVKTGIDQLVGPRTWLEEHEFDLTAAFARSIEHRMKHRLGASEAIAPWHGYEYAHGLCRPSSDDLADAMQADSKLSRASLEGI